MKPPQKGEFSQLIGERVMNGSLPGNIMAMHNKFYWHRLSIEDKRGKSPGVEISLTELRQRIYRIVLPRQECSVTEYGGSPWKPRRSTDVSRVVLLLIPGLNSSASVGHYHIVTSIRYTVEFVQSYT